jgi:hypothetical protein
MPPKKLPDNQITVYQTPDGKINIEVLYANENIWLSQKRMADLFGCTADNVSLHLKNIFKEKELDEEATTQEFSVVQREGDREVTRKVFCYSLEAIIAVGYRVNSERGTQFRQWATTILQQYIHKGFALDSDRFKYGSRFSARFLYVVFAVFTGISDVNASDKIADLFRWPAESNYFYADISYRQELYGNILSNGKGIGGALGFNFFKFINDAITIAPFCDLSWYWDKSFSKDFVSDLNTHGFSFSYFNSEESQKSIDSMMAGRVETSLDFNYGIFFRGLNQYIPPIKLYGIFYQALLFKEHNEPTGFVYQEGLHNHTIECNGFGIEVFLFKGFFLGGNVQLNFGYLSCSLDFLNFKNASLGGNTVFDFVDDEFKRKYGTAFRIGFKIGINAF